jgi:hypothetical protein
MLGSRATSFLFCPLLTILKLSFRARPSLCFVACQLIVSFFNHRRVIPDRVAAFLISATLMPCLIR